MHPAQSPVTSTPLGARASGVLLHLSSLPGGTGTGDMGAEARALVDALVAAGQRYWQLLPLNPTAYHADDSPYFSSSALAGNPLLVSLPALVDEGLLRAEELPPADDPGQQSADFDRARALKLPLLDRAGERLLAQPEGAARYREFCAQQAHWLGEHALFEALKARDPRLWSDWPEPLRDRDPAALAQARAELAREIEREQLRQYFFFHQWCALKGYANERGLLIFGDTPIYVSFDSVDVWLQPQLFQLSPEKQPLAVAGVPPDYFSETGQLWNNPLYDWEAMAAEDFRWWRDRMRALFERFDVVRIDHFRGLVQYWSVPAGAQTALGGHWADVPSHALFDTLQAAFEPFPVVAEDLGTITPDVVAVKEHYGFPGMVVLHFAFSEDNPDNPYRPENHPECAIAYLGTHDNTTTRAWLDTADPATLERLAHYTGSGPGQHTVRAMIGLLLSSPARIAIVTAQDLLELPAEARMNDPGRRGANWSWRLSRQQFEALPLHWLAQACREHGR